MEQVYLGFFSSIFNAIYKAIIKPIIDFLGGILQTVFTWVFEKILKPLLVNIFLPLFKALLEMVWEIIAGIVYSIYATLLSIIDAAQELFNLFAGITKVSIKGQEGKSYTMLEFFFNQSFVRRGLLILSAVAVGLLIMFAIIAVLKSIGELGEQQRPVTKVLHATWQGFLRLILIPFTCLFLVALSGVLLTGINDALNAAQTGSTDKKTTIARTIFVVSSMDAAENESMNVSTSSEPSKLGIDDSLRSAYYYSGTGSKSYSDKSQVESDFKFTKFNYFVGFGAGLILLFILALSVFKFINRIFNVMILYITAPLFVASTPLDDGEKYESWKSMFIGQLFSAYGSVIGIQIYLMLMPAVMSGGIGFGLSTEGDMAVRIIFLIGGAFAVKNAGPMVTGLVDSASAGMERQQDAAFYGFTSAMGGLAWVATSQAWAKLRRGGGGGGGGGGAAGGEGEGGEGGGKFDGKGGGKGGKAGTKGGKKIGMKGSIAARNAETRRKKQEAAAKKQKKSNVKLSADGTKKTIQKKWKPYEDKKKKAGIEKSYLGGLFTKGKDANGKSRFGVNFGKHFQFGMQKDGTYRTNIFGFGARYTKDGKLDKVNVPFMRFKRGEDGKMHVSRVRLTNGMQFKRAETVTKDGNGNIISRKLGKMSCTNFSPIGYKKSFDENGNANVRCLGFGARYNKDGQMDKLSVPFMRFKRGEDGKMQLAKVKISSGMQFKRTETVTKDADGNITGRKMGDMFCSRFSPLGIEKQFDETDGKVHTTAVLGKHWEKNEESGEYEMTHRNFLGTTSYYARDKEGNYHTVYRKGFTSDREYSLDENTGKRTLEHTTSFGGKELYASADYAASREAAQSGGHDFTNHLGGNESFGDTTASGNRTYESFSTSDSFRKKFGFGDDDDRTAFSGAQTQASHDSFSNHVTEPKAEAPKHDFTAPMQEPRRESIGSVNDAHSINSVDSGGHDFTSHTTDSISGSGHSSFRESFGMGDVEVPKADSGFNTADSFSTRSSFRESFGFENDSSSINSTEPPKHDFTNKPISGKKN